MHHLCTMLHLSMYNMNKIVNERKIIEKRMEGKTWASKKRRK